MTDDRDRSSPSDDLVREARQRVLDGELDSDDVIRTPNASPSDSRDYLDSRLEPAADDVTSGDDADLSAVDIAALLGDGKTTSDAGPSERRPVMYGSGEDDRDGRARADTSSLPGRAIDESSNESTSPGTPLDSTDTAAATGSLADRIRTLSQDRPEHGLSTPVEVEPDTWPPPGSGWEAPPNHRTRRSFSTSWIRPAVALVFFGIMGVGFIVGQFDGLESIENVVVGDCFDVGAEATIYDVPIINCSEPHDAELFALIEVTGFGSTYPGDDPLFESTFEACEDRFAAYVGEPYEVSEYWIQTITPTEEGWADGDRIGMCAVVRYDDDLAPIQSVGSAKGPGDRT